MKLRAIGANVLATVIASMALSAAAGAQAPLNYSSGPTVLTGVGDQIWGSPYDVLSLGASAGKITTNGDYSLGPLSFTAGLNALSDSPYSVTGNFIDKLTIGGVTENISIGYTANINAVESCTRSLCSFGDTIQLNNTVVTYSPYLTLDILATSLTSYGSTASTTLVADVTRLPVTVAAPELDAGSLTGGLSLLIGGVLLLRGRRPLSTQAV